MFIHHRTHSSFDARIRRGFETMPVFTHLAIEDPNQLRFGIAPRPLTTRRGLVIGGGLVYPELNFTLPTMLVDESTMPDVRQQYREIIAEATQRAVDLEVPGLVIEFETLPPMTENPHWAAEITALLHEEMERAHAAHSLKSVLRVTPTDIRDMTHPPRMRSGRAWESMLQTFEMCTDAGAELLSIESTGGKEVHDRALMHGDLSQVLFALCIMGVRDMRFLWSHLAAMAGRHNAHLAGDTACGFGNTAMVLAEQGMVPRVFAAVVRAVSAVRSLVAYECGAVGPGKDCGYENPILKAITGFPMAMEGKTAACAHLSRLGNIAAATCDTWSNESVQNIRLLGGMAPTCYLEQLVYDCRLMNRALADGPDAALQLRKWMVQSDAGLDPQAYILTPENAIAIAHAIVSAGNPYLAGCAAAGAAMSLMREGVTRGELKLAAREATWLDRLQKALNALPLSQEEFIHHVMSRLDLSTFTPEDYELPVTAGSRA
jgi:methanol---5-hydroxybenzimidazolylcobamide Co-methyltransferase